MAVFGALRMLNEHAPQVAFIRLKRAIYDKFKFKLREFGESDSEHLHSKP